MNRRSAWRSVTWALLLALPGPIATASDRQFFQPDAAKAGHSLPFSTAVLVADTLYVSGQLGFEPGTNRIPEDITKQAEFVMDALERAVESAGLSLADVVSVTVYSTDLADNKLFDPVYRRYFAAPFPARAMVGVDALALGARFEVSAIAVRRRKDAP